MKHTKRQLNIARLLLFLFVLMLLTGCREETRRENDNETNVTNVTSDFYVNDFAGLFTKEQKESLMEKAISLDRDYAGVQVVITTVKSLQECVGESVKEPNVEQVAHAMYNQYGIGQDSMGVLILLSVEDRAVRIEVGTQMEGYITDRKAGQLRDDYGMEHFRQDQFAEGLISLQSGIISEIEAVVPANWNDSQGQATIHSAMPTLIPEKTVLLQEEEKAKEAENGNTQWKIFAVTATAIIAMLVELAVFLIQNHSQRKRSENEKEKLRQQLVEQKNKHEAEIQEIFESRDKELSTLRNQHEQEIELLINKTRSQVEVAELSLKRTEEREKALISKLCDSEEEKTELKQQLTALQEKYDRAQRLHSDVDFEAEIQEMIENEFRTSAAKVDQELAQYLAMYADKDRIQEFKYAIDKYNGTEPDVKKYLTTDVKELQSLYEQSQTLFFKSEAAKLDENFARVLNMPADKDSISEFKTAISKYETIRLEIKEHMTTDIQKLRKLYSESCSIKQEYERQEQEKRDRTEAERVYNELLAVSRKIRKGTHENREELQEACQRYEKMGQGAKNFFQDFGLIRTLRNLLREAEEDTSVWKAAKEAESSIQSTVSRVGYSASESDKDRLERAMNTYRNLSSAQQIYVSQELVRSLNRLMQQAVEDEERRRRRRESELLHRRATSSDFGSSSFGRGRSFGSHGGSFGGHGGSSRGGGVSGHF